MLKKIAVLHMLCLMTLVLAALGGEACAADYVVQSQPLYALDTQDKVNTESKPLVGSEFTHTEDWFMTTSAAELNKCISEGWVSRGIACYTAPAQVPGSVPLYRMYNTALRDHIYTSKLEEFKALQQLFYKPEGIVGYVFPKGNPVPGTVPLHRIRKTSGGSYHRYSLSPTISGSETYEGIECHVWPRAQAVVSLEIIRPQANEEIKGLSTYDISWKTSLKGGYIALYYSTDAGNTWKQIAYGLENTGFTKWKVPNANTLHGRLKILWNDNLFAPTTKLAETSSRYDFRIKQATLQKQSIPSAVKKMN